MNISERGLKIEQSGRLVWLDALRVLACFGVVALHVWAPVTYMFFSLPALTWWAGNATMVLIASWSVPMFVMISGALLLSSPNHEHVRRFFSGRARIFWQTAFWMVFFVIFRLVTEKDFDAGQAVDSMKHGTPYYHMWFLNMILGLYFCTPILCWFVRSVSRPWRVVSIMVLMFLSMVWPLVQRHYFPLYHHTVITLFVPFAGYYLLGYELMNVRIERKMAMRFVVIFLVAAVLLMCLTFLSARRTLTIMPVWWLHCAFSPLVVVMSVSLFQFFHAVANEFSSADPPRITIRRFRVFVENLTPLTLGIYVIHPLLIRLLTHIGLIDAYEWGGASLAVVVLVVFLWSAMTVWAMSEIPFIRVLVSGRR